MGLEVDIRKRYRGFLLDVRFSAEGRCALMGASGSGKSLTLAAVAGAMTPDEGRIALDGETFFDSARGVNLPPQRRGVGLMFQHYALFPNMTVEENILCGLRARRPADARARVAGLVEALHLAGLERLRPAQLSGGQQQRVALARILASEPRLILLDEPFAALDSHLEWQLEREVAQALAGFSGTSVFVTHDFPQAYRLCDRVTILDGGRVSASGGRAALYEAPGTLAAALMTGCRNISAARKVGPDRVYASEWGIELEARAGVPDGVRYVGVRADAIQLAEGEGVNRFPWRAAGCACDPGCSALTVSLGGQAPLRWELSREDFARLEGIPRGELHIPPERVHPLTG